MQNTICKLLHLSPSAEGSELAAGFVGGTGNPHISRELQSPALLDPPGARTDVVLLRRDVHKPFYSEDTEANSTHAEGSDSAPCSTEPGTSKYRDSCSRAVTLTNARLYFFMFAIFKGE